MAISRAQRIQAQEHSSTARDLLPDLEKGRFIWNGTTNQLEVYDGVDWETFFYQSSTINGNQITGSIDGALLTGTIDGALLGNQVAGSLLTGTVDAALVDGVLNGGSY
tara:strand:+ start:906 stop:1229 length:324 start_codon:yes stop_codon:yes gene_type:complete